MANKVSGSELKEKSKGFINEFREFISRGSVVDLAVGMVVGAAFTAIVTSLVNDIVMPVLGVIVGGINFSDLTFTLVPASASHAEVCIYWGKFLQAVINFLAISLVVFMAIKAINSAHAKFAKKDNAAAEAEAEAEKNESEVDLLKQIRDAVVNRE